MKKIMLFLIFIFLLTPGIWAGGFKDAYGSYIIDDFEDGDLTQVSKWWQFGKIEVTLNDNENNPFEGLGKKSLSLKGNTKGWYIGGVGTTVGIDATVYNTLKLLVQGVGKNSATLMVELYDDDNGNSIIEKSNRNPSLPLFDDKFVYSLNVDWEGWKVVMIPLNRFVDGNHKLGNDIFDPSTENGSGGLVQIQFILASYKKEGYAQIEIDQVKLIKEEIPLKRDQNELYYDDVNL